MISYHGLDGFPPGGMFSYRVVGNQTTLVGFLTGRLDFIPDPLVGLDVAVNISHLIEGPIKVRLLFAWGVHHSLLPPDIEARISLMQKP